MALPPRRYAHFDKMNSRGAKGKPWASFLRHLPGETLILKKRRARTSTAVPPQYRRSTTAVPAHLRLQNHRDGRTRHATRKTLFLNTPCHAYTDTLPRAADTVSRPCWANTARQTRHAHCTDRCKKRYAEHAIPRTIAREQGRATANTPNTHNTQPNTRNTRNTQRSDFQTRPTRHAQHATRGLKTRPAALQHDTRIPATCPAGTEQP
jgi:hypothetical protein